MESNELERSAIDSGRGISGLLLFGLSGALFWGMRGATGYGGISGAVIPGLIWGLIWYKLTRLEDATPSALIVLASTLGFGLGGFNGYGQYISWIRGAFHINYPDTFAAIAPWKGYFFLFATGAGWGGLGGVMLSWIYGDREKQIMRLLRIAVLPVGFYIGRMIVTAHPNIFVPFYGYISFSPEDCSSCERTYSTTVDLVSYCSMTVIALMLELTRFNFRSIAMIVTAALGFGVAFAATAPFHLVGYHLPFFDWWKAWEMSIGFIGGATIWFICKQLRPFNIRYDPHSWHEDKNTKLGLVDLPTFVVLVWAFINCAQVHWHGPRDIDFFSIMAFIPICAYVVLRQRPFSHYREALVTGGLIPRDRLLFPLVSLSLMSLIVIWPDYRVMAVFFILAAASLYLNFVLGKPNYD